MQKGGYVYIVTNKHHTTLYIGITSDLLRRIFQHKEHYIKKSFSDKYNIEKLVFYQEFSSIEEAILYEKKIKKWRREKKNELVTGMNAQWDDLYESIGGPAD
ncbi:MAG TPA: GIY-YIG nuclease family protein [Flavipsychrobacter sp.]|nr:GIY-YIG nuclease family protein [Flavipsychrobacter sp.]